MLGWGNPKLWMAATNHLLSICSSIHPSCIQTFTHLHIHNTIETCISLCTIHSLIQPSTHLLTQSVITHTYTRTYICTCTHTYWCIYTNMHTYIYPCIVHPLQIFPEPTAQIMIRKFEGAQVLYFSKSCSKPR